MMALGYLLHLRYPLPLLPAQAARVLSLALLIFSLFVAFSAAGAMHRAHTSVLPMRPTTALVTSGPYRWSRNPIYIAEMGVYLAVAAWVNGWALVLLFPVLFLLLDRGVVRREEVYLRGKFGPEYEAYMRAVRRWV